jgi:sulfoxide reductase heme-binding subunit YedZ
MATGKAVNPLRITVNILAPMPLVVLAWAYFTNRLTINPIQAATQRAGDIAIIFLLLCLACSPVNTLFDLPMVLKLRRPLGLWSFYYACIHMLSYVGLDYGFDFRLFNMDNGNKLYVYFGLLTLTLLTAMALTSRKWWKIKLGKRWKQLHKLVYVAGVAAVWHLSLAVKGNLLSLMGNIWKPLTAGAVVFVALTLRIPPVKAWVIEQRQKIQAAMGRKRSTSDLPKAPTSISGINPGEH